MLKYTELCKNVYLVKEDTKRVNILNSLLIEDIKEPSTILIDANYTFKHIDALYTRIKSPVTILIFSHCHLDHTAHAFYHQKYGTPIYCPIQEEKYMKSIEYIMDVVGFSKLGLKDTYLMMVKNYMKFQECTQVNTFNPGSGAFKFSNFKIGTIHIPGHSPGHTAFVIESNKSNQFRKVLYASDIGSHPYYGDLNSNLKQYEESIDRLERLYLSDDYILVPAHGSIYLEKDENFFKRIRKRIDSNENKVLNALSKTNSKSIKELVYEQILTPKERINPTIKDLYLLWDGGMIYHHLSDFIEQGIVKKIEEIDFLNDKYILI